MSKPSIKRLKDKVNELEYLVNKLRKLRSLYNDLEETQGAKFSAKKKKRTSASVYDKGRPKYEDFAHYTEYDIAVYSYNRKNNDFRQYVNSSYSMSSSKESIRKILKEIAYIKKNVGFNDYLKQYLGVCTTKSNSVKRWNILYNKAFMLRELYIEQQRITKMMIRTDSIIYLVKKNKDDLKELSKDGTVLELFNSFADEIKINKNIKRKLINRYKVNKDTIKLILSGHLDKTF